MKKILFVINKLSGAGIEKSLVSLLNSISPEKYTIYLKAFQLNGLFADQVPSNVLILPEEEQFFTIKDSVKFYFKRLELIKCILRLFLPLIKKMCKKNNNLEWKIRKLLFHKDNNQYDAAIAYADGIPLYYVVNMVNSNYKIAWNHLDYSISGYNHDIDSYYFKRIDKMVVISKSCEQSLIKSAPEIIGKTYMIENIIDADKIIDKGNCYYPKEFEGVTGLKILSIGRLSKQKGYKYSISAMRFLKEAGIDFKFYIIGIGSEETNIRKLASELGIEKNVILLKEKSNPYVYLKNCDIYLQTSIIEGKSIALEEAKIFNKPIVITKFPTCVDQIKNGVTGIICNHDDKEISDAIISIYENKDLITTFEDNLKQINKGNKKEALMAFDLLMEEKNE